MDFFVQFLLYLLPFLLFLICCIGFYFFNQSARRRKVSAIALGVLLQALLPDPKVEQTIKMVTEVKKTKYEKRAESGAADDE